MKHVDYAYTRGMDESEVEVRLRNERTGVLALSHGGDAYAFPTAHYYDGDRLYVRLGRTPDSDKWDAIERTETATYVLYGTEPTDGHETLDSWSVLVRGRLSTVPREAYDRFDTEEINERFTPIRVFDEAIEDVEIVILELEMSTVTGRASVEP